MPFLKTLMVCMALALSLPQLRAAQPKPPVTGSLAHQLEADFVAAFEKVAPSVVVIEAEKPEQDRDIVWRMFFDSPEQQRPNEDGEGENKKPEKDDLPAPKTPRKLRPRPEMPQNQGSGTIIRGDGYIVTNYHVIEGATKVWVYLRDGSKHEASLVGAEPQADLASISSSCRPITSNISRRRHPSIRAIAGARCARSMARSSGSTPSSGASAPPWDSRSRRISCHRSAPSLSRRAW